MAFPMARLLAHRSMASPMSRLLARGGKVMKSPPISVALTTHPASFSPCILAGPTSMLFSSAAASGAGGGKSSDRGKSSWEGIWTFYKVKLVHYLDEFNRVGNFLGIVVTCCISLYTMVALENEDLKSFITRSIDQVCENVTTEIAAIPRMEGLTDLMEDLRKLMEDLAPKQGEGGEGKGEAKEGEGKGKQV